MTSPHLPTPAEAAAALADARRRQHDAVDAAYNTPAWYFWGIAALLALFAVVYGTNDWIEQHLGRGLALTVFIVGILIPCAGLGALVGAVVRRAPAAVSKPPVTFKDVLLIAGACVVAIIAAFGITYALLGELEPSTMVVLLLMALLCGFGGRPLQQRIRARAHRALDEAEGAAR